MPPSITGPISRLMLANEILTPDKRAIRQSWAEVRTAFKEKRNSRRNWEFIGVCLLLAVCWAAIITFVVAHVRPHA